MHLYTKEIVLLLKYRKIHDEKSYFIIHILLFYQSIWIYNLVIIPLFFHHDLRFTFFNDVMQWILSIPDIDAHMMWLQSCYTSRGYIFTAVCLCVCLSVCVSTVFLWTIFQPNGCTDLDAVFAKWLLTALARTLLKLVTLGQRSRSRWRNSHFSFIILC